MMGGRGLRRVQGPYALPAARGQQGFLSQRAWGIVLVLGGLMLVPYWMAKKVGDKTVAQAGAAPAPQPALATASAPGSVPSSMPDNTQGNVTTGSTAPSTASTAPATSPSATATAPASAVNPDRFGLSFGHGALPSPQSGLMHSACAGTPLDMANLGKNQCNPAQGDTSCRTALPVLCVLKDGSTPESAELVKDPKAEGAAAAGPDFHAAWVGGTLAATTPVAGFVIGSRAQADARCASELGTGWRMAELRDAGAGLALVGKRGLGLATTNTRHWVTTHDQKSNCWDPS